MIQRTLQISCLLLAAAACCLVPARTAAQPVIPSNFVLPSTAADTSKPGFRWRVHQVPYAEETSNTRAENQLAGLLGDNIADPNAQGVAIEAAAPPNPSTAPIEFAIPTVINMSTYGGWWGYFSPDDLMPGLPGTTGIIDYAAGEILTWLDLPVGTITFVATTDDGFRMTVGGVSARDAFAVQVGDFDGGRSTSESWLSFKITQAGLYPVRVLWENGCCEGTIELSTVAPDGTRTLVNDVSNGGIPAYRGVTVQSQRAYARFLSPSPNDGGVPANIPIRLELIDGATPVNPSSIKLSLDGLAVKATVVKSANLTTATFQSPTRSSPGSQHTATLSYTEGSVATTFTWTFAVQNYVGPTGNIYEVVIAPGGITWPEAQAATEVRTWDGHPGHLATITSPEEDSYLEELRRAAHPIGGYSQLWVGGYQIPGSPEPTEGWFWVNNEGPIPLNYSGLGYANWLPGQPDNYWSWLGGSEEYLAIGLSGRFGWNDSGSAVNPAGDRNNAAGYIVEYEAAAVNIDIMPHEKLNIIKLTSPLRVEVGILSSPTFDPATVDVSTITFGRTGSEARPVITKLDDLNGDRRKDLLLTFKIQDLGLQCGDNAGFLRARTKGGYPIRGNDSVQTESCQPYTLSAVGLQDVHKLTDVYLTVSVVANNCVAPAKASEVHLKSVDVLGRKRWSADAARVAFSLNPGNTSTADLQYSTLLPAQEFSAQVDVASCIDGQTLSLHQNGIVLLRPDLTVQSIQSPESTYSGVPVSITAIITELNTQLGATASVYLMEGDTIRDQRDGVGVGAGGTSAVVFSTILDALGTHTLRVVVGNVSPGDYDTSNNEQTFNIEATQQPASYYSSYSRNEFDYYHEFFSPGYVSGIESQQGRSESFTETLYWNGFLQFPVDFVSVQVTADGSPKAAYEIANLEPTYYYYDGVSYGYGYAYQHLADGEDLYLSTQFYSGYGYTYAQYNHVAADAVYYSEYHYVYYGDYLNSSTSKAGSFFDPSSQLDTRFILQSSGVTYGGSAQTPVYAYPYNSSWDYSDPSTGYYDRGHSQGSNSYGYSSGLVTP